jgi:elongator complex protein 1
MPRGNLETISPREIIFNNLNKLMLKEHYKEVLIISRKFMIDLNYIYLNLKEDKYEKFIKQIENVQHLNLFLTQLNLKETEVDNFIKVFSDILINLEDKKKYISSIITCFLKSKKTGIEKALNHILKTFEYNSELFDFSLEYLIFLSNNIETVFNISLGMISSSFKDYITSNWY